jgi:NAD(P)-dependent dehydrogenase (short-subunit alcohol dehydrogenase family)
MARLNGKVALVTGASMGFGAAIARRFGEEEGRSAMLADRFGGGHGWVLHPSVVSGSPGI